MPQDLTYRIPFVKNTTNFVKFDIPFRQGNMEFAGGVYVPRAQLQSGQDYEVVVTVRKVAGK